MAGSERDDAARAAAKGVGRGGGLSSFALKAAAIVGMTANHAAYIFAEQISVWTATLLVGVGGITFPIMAFLLVEGYRRTSNVKRYALRLAGFSLVSQIPYGLFLANDGNVLFTLLIGLGVLYADDHVRNRAVFWGITAAGALASLSCDWGLLGVVMVLLFKMFGAGPDPCAAPGGGATVEEWAPEPGRPRRSEVADVVPAGLLSPLGAVAAPVLLAAAANGLPRLGELASAVGASGDWSLLPFVVYALVGCPLAIPLLRAYRGRRGLPMKWFFYAYYPGHIAVLGVARLLLFG